jgi:uncharacterized protein YbaP (TraB family)
MRLHFGTIPAAVAALLAAPLAALLATGPAAAAPALWRASDADSTIYLFGSVHALKPGTVWRTPLLDRAFADSTELWVEATDIEDPASLQEAVLRLGFDAEHPLSSLLSEEDRARLAAVLERIGLPAAAVEPMRPWLAAAAIAVTPLVGAGVDMEAGVDTTLLADARATAKAAVGFETGEEQLHFMADLPQPVALELLRRTMEDLDVAARVAEITAVWLAGDVERLTTLVLFDDPGPPTEATDAFYRILLVERNARWAARLADRLDGAGTSFVVVGAGHLLGPDSLLVMLEAEGVTIERLQ